MTTLFRKKPDFSATLAPNDPFYVDNATNRKGSFSAPSFDHRFYEGSEREYPSNKGVTEPGNVKKVLGFSWGKKQNTLTVISNVRSLSPTNLPPLPPSPVTPIAAKFSTGGLGLSPVSPTSPISPGGGSAARLSTIVKFPAPPTSTAPGSSSSMPTRVNLPTRRSSLIGNGASRHQTTSSGSTSTVSTFQTTSSFASSKLFHSSNDDFYESSSDATTMSLTSSPEGKALHSLESRRRMWKVKGLQESPLKPQQVIPPSHQRRNDGLRPPCEEDEDEYVRTSGTSRRNSTPVPGFLAALLGVEPETPPRPKRWSASSNRPADDSPPFDLAREKAVWRASHHSGKVAPHGKVSDSPGGRSDDADDEVSPPRWKQWASAPPTSLGSARIPSLHFGGISMDAMFEEVEKKMQSRTPPKMNAVPSIEIVESTCDDEEKQDDDAAEFAVLEAAGMCASRDRKGARRRTRVISAYRPSSGYWNVEEDETTISPTPDEMDALRGEAKTPTPETAASYSPSQESPIVPPMRRPDIVIARPSPRRQQPRPSRLDIDLANSFDRAMGSLTPTTVSSSTAAPYSGVVPSPRDTISCFSESTDSNRGSVDLFSPVESSSATPQQATFVLPSPPSDLSPSPSLAEPFSPTLSVSPPNKASKKIQGAVLVPEGHAPNPAASSIARAASVTRPVIPSVFVFPPNGPAYRRGDSSDWEGAPPAPGPVACGTTKIIVVQPKRMYRASTRPAPPVNRRDAPPRHRNVISPVPSERFSSAPPSPALSSTSTVHQQDRAPSPVGWSFPRRDGHFPAATASAQLDFLPSSCSQADSVSDYGSNASRLGAPRTPPRARTTSGPSARSTSSSGLTASALLRHTKSQSGLSMLEREMGGLSASSSSVSLKGGPEITVTAPGEDNEVDENAPSGFEHLVRSMSKSPNLEADSPTDRTSYDSSDDSISRYGDAPLRVKIAPPIVPALVEASAHIAMSERAHSGSGASSTASSDAMDEKDAMVFGDESAHESESDEIDLMTREVERTLASIEESVAASNSSLASSAVASSHSRSMSVSSSTSSIALAYAVEPKSALSQFTNRSNAISHSRNWSDASASTISTDCSSSSNSSDERHAEIAVVMTGHRVSCTYDSGSVARSYSQEPQQAVIGQAM